MKRRKGTVLFFRKMGTVLFLCVVVSSLGGHTYVDQVRFDHEMVEKGIAWLKLVRDGADEKTRRAFFMQEVFPTRGCQAIIHHWERFRKWDAEELYAFILTALELQPSDAPLRNEDGTPSALAMRRKFWQDALNNIAGLEQDLEELKQTDLSRSIMIAREYLPEEVELQAEFYFVLFGHSSAFSVGAENGFDFLQLPKENGKVDMEALIQILAHELHHSGFDYLIKKNLNNLSSPENLLLLGILAAEGMPTYFIDKPWLLVPRYLRDDNPQRRQYARDWEKHSARIQELYQEAERDIRLNLEGKLDRASVMNTWMHGIKGPAYVLGADMFSVIDGYLGREVALKVAADFRKFLLYYNYAAEKAGQAGFRLHVFDEKLVQSLARHGE
jgi:hypothetical protein